MEPRRLSPLVELLRCLECGEAVQIEELASQPGYPELGVDGWLRCGSCRERYPVIAGTPRMLNRTARSGLGDEYPAAAIDLPRRGGRRDAAVMSIQERTAESFAFEWRHFGEHRSEWRKNFLDYLQPHSPGFLAGKLVLDVGAGSGRHSAQAAELGARVVAIDLGRSIDVARRNVPDAVLTVQADAERLPFAPDRFDFVMSIGVLHHLPNTERALQGLVPFVAPGGNLHVYLYWVPEAGWHRGILRLVSAARKFTVRMPFWLLRLLCYPLSVVLWIGVVLPYRLLRRIPAAAALAAGFPLKTYADYPFGVLVNDQFDRLSAPIEQRFTKAEVQNMLTGGGLDPVTVIPNHGWVGDGRRPQGVPAVGAGRR